MLPVGARCSACCLHVESWDERLIDEIGKSKIWARIGKKIGRLLQVNTFLFGFSDLTGAGACLSSLNAVRDVSRELDNKSRRAMGGFPIVYKTRWVPPGAPPIEVSFTLCPETGKFILLFA